MEYKKVKELLLSSEALTEKDASEILNFWQESPRSYLSFLRNKDVAQTLYMYAGADAVTTEHQFTVTNHHVPTTEIALKFFSLENDEITTQFVRVIVENTFGRDPELDICAWPYLNSKCMSYLSREFIMELVVSMQFVFDFNADEKGYLFDMVYKKIQVPVWKFMFSINSFNNLAWASTAERCGDVETLRSYFLASYAYQYGAVDEAYFRKRVIEYLNEVESSIIHIQQQLAEDAGVVFN